MSLFDLFLICHLTGDWMFQTSEQAANKAKGNFINWAILNHSLVYTLTFVPVFLIFGISFYWLAIIFVSHVILDKRSITRWWVRKIKTMDPNLKGCFFSFDAMTIVIDQVIHILILAVIALLIT